MKKRWLEKIKSCEELGQEIGCKIKSITSGQLVIGEEDALDSEGNPIKIPITKPGIEIEFEREPTAEQVSKLDNLFSLQNLKREGGKDLVAELDDLKVRIEKLERLGRK